MVPVEQSVPAVYMRGGTSKALYFHEKDIPAPGDERTRFLRRIMGSPDPLQIDGMGGSHLVTSKVAIMRPSKQEGADVDYTFVQVGIGNDLVTYDGNCGNISAGVGPFAIDEGLVKGGELEKSSVEDTLKCREVKIFNTGTKKLLIAHVPIDEKTGKSLEKGDFDIAGCPGTAAPILMDYRQVIGAALGGGAIPTGQPTNKTTIDGKDVDFTVCDVANIIVFAKATDLGITGGEAPADLDADEKFIARVKELRGKGAQYVGMCKDWEKVDEQSPMLPMVALVSSPTNPQASIQSRLFLDNHCHTAMAGTGAICTTACGKIPGTVVEKLVNPDRVNDTSFQIQHPQGLMPVVVATEKGEDLVPTFKTLSFVRTARRIWDGHLYVPDDVVDTMSKIPSLSQDSEKPSVHAVETSESTSTSDTTSSSSASESSKATTLSTTEDSKPTKRFAEFVHDLQYEDLPEEAVEKLKGLILDHIGDGAGASEEAESTGPFVKAIKSLDLNGGKNTVIANGRGFSAPYAALLNGALGHSLDFDDTNAASYLHPGVGVIPCALAEAESNPGTSVKDVLLALAAGYEVTCRLGAALSSGGYTRGFHNTAVAGIFGAISVISKLRKLDVSVIVNAYGLGISKAAGSMQYLSNGSWNKRLHPGFASHDAFIVVALAQAGVLGAADPFDGEYGLLHAYTANPNPSIFSVPFDNSKFHFVDTAIKPYPACRLTHGEIELATQMTSKLSRPVTDAEKITITLSRSALGVVGESVPNKIHPSNIVDAQFSVFYQTAIALAYGSGLGWKAYSKLADATIKDLTSKMSVEVDDAFSTMQTRIALTWPDGTTDSDTLMEPSGEPDNPLRWDGIARKFMGLAVPVFGQDRADKIVAVLKDFESSSIEDLMQLVA